MLMMNCSILGSDALTNMALYIHNASTCLVAAIVFFFTSCFCLVTVTVCNYTDTNV